MQHAGVFAPRADASSSRSNPQRHVDDRPLAGPMALFSHNFPMADRQASFGFDRA